MRRHVPLAALALLAALLPALPARAADDKDGLRVVTIKITDNVSEDPTPVNPLGPQPLNFRARLLQLRALAGDPKVAGVRLELKGHPDFAHAIDLLEALDAVHKAGKPIVCYSDTLGDRELMIASKADLLAIPAGGMVGLEGLAAQVMYLKGVLDKLHVRFEVMHVGNFKTAYEDLAKDAMSDEQRMTIQSLLDEWWEQMVSTIAANRNIGRDRVLEAFDRVLLMPDEARDLGLIDVVASEDAFEQLVEARLGGAVSYDDSYGQMSAEEFEQMMANPFAALSMLPKLLNPPEPERPKKPYVGIVYASGPINTGKSQAGFDGKVTQMGSETIVAALDKVLEDDNCKAVVLRVNSPGGSALASDLMWDGVQRVCTKKPVVASMGYVAGSGGYWISMGCDAILAQPGTITGSIGVVSMLPDVSAVLQEIGVRVELVSAGPHGEELAIMKNGPTPFVKELITRSMEKTYDEFVAKVAKGRKLDEDRVREIARGRVWTGRQGEEIGLVDELGGLDDAIALACVLGGGLDPATTPVAEFPQPPKFMDALQEAFDNMAGVDTPAAKLLAGMSGLPVVSELAPLLRSAFDGRGVLTADRVQALMPFAISLN